jgi:hypothetical protein
MQYAVQLYRSRVPMFARKAGQAQAFCPQRRGATVHVPSGERDCCGLQQSCSAFESETFPHDALYGRGVTGKLRQRKRQHAQQADV